MSSKDSGAKREAEDDSKEEEDELDSAQMDEMV